MKAYLLWLAKLITIVVLFLIIVPAIMVGILGATHQVLQTGIVPEVGSSAKQVAVIEMNGMIVDSKGILQKLYKQAENKKIKGIVLRINSPGGAVGPSQEIFETVKELKAKKPIVVSMGTVAASGGLYSALGASKIFCQPGTLTGSIGVIMQVPNLSKIADKLGVEMVTIKSGKFKDVGNSFRKMTPAERTFLQSSINTANEAFIKAIVEGRGIEESEVLKFADGRIILGSEALDYKLVDEIGTVYDAARAVFDILEKPLKDDERPKLIYTEDKFDKLRKMLEGLMELPLNVLQRNTFGRNIEMLYLMQ